MFTVCPKCTLTLAVTANDLRVGQGYVRCGRCSNVFNALLKLSEAPAEGAGAPLPELAQADPASTSQIHRAITAAAIDGGAASAAAGAASPPLRSPARPPTPPATARSPAMTPGAALSPTSSSAPAPPGAAKTSPGDAAAAMPRRRASELTPAAHAGHAAPPPAQRAPSTPPTSVATAASAAKPPSAPAARAPSSAGSVALAAAPAASASAARASVTPAPARAAQGTPVSKGSAALSGDAPAKQGDADALDQFELILQTLGLNADGEEDPPLRAHGPAPEPPQRVENIVLEGDEVRQEMGPSDARPSDDPLDELDTFTRRLGIATVDKPSATSGGADAAAPGRPQSSAQSAMGEGEGDRESHREGPAGNRQLATRRARPAGRRSTDAPISGDGTLAAARAAGRDPGVSASDAPQVEEAARSPAAAGSPDLDIPALRAAPPMQQRFWLAGSIALLVLLLAQLVNHWRDALAASPTWGHPVTGLYATLGLPLQPRWDLSAYEVRQQGAESAGGPHAAIRVRFSLANHATRAQPVPELRLTLLDRYGRRVAERDLKPADYWPKGRATQSFLSADERVDTEVQVLDPSADSASFELDVCLPDARGGMQCAGDAAAAQAAGVPP